jgi:hypothetical protein
MKLDQDTNQRIVGYTPSNIDVTRLLRLSEISEPLKQKLLSTASNYAAIQLDGATLLEKMRAIDPIESRNFATKKEAISEFQLRLLLKETEPDHCIRSFITISYCWHSDEWAASPELTKTSDFPTTQEMTQFVIRDILEKGEGIWVDQLCINQQDESEKIMAISAMDLVYRSARLVAIFLEDISLTAAEWASICSFYPFNPTSTLAQHEISRAAKPYLAASKKILSSRWFTRAWCLHEFLCNRNSELFILVKTIGIKRYKLRLLLQTIYALQVPLSYPYDIELYSPSRLSALRILTKEHVEMSLEKTGRNHWEIFRHCLGMKCSNEYDKLSIFLNLSRTSLAFISKPNHDYLGLFYSAALVALAAGDVDFLSHSTPLQLPRKWSTLQRSWSISWMPYVPLPEVSYDILAMPSPKVHTSNGAITCRWSQMKLDVIVFTNWACVEVEESYRTTSVHMTKSIKSVENRINPSFNRSDWITLARGPLAAVMKLGPSWIREFSGNVRRKMASTIRECSNSSFARWKSQKYSYNSKITKILSQQTPLYLSDLEENDDALEAEELTAGLLWTFDIFSCWGDAPKLCGIVDLDKSQDGLSGLTNFTQSHWEELYRDDCILAMPKLMTDARFSLHDRLWILQPVKEQGKQSYRIVSKRMVLGFVDINESPPTRVTTQVQIFSWRDDLPQRYQIPSLTEE